MLFSLTYLVRKFRKQNLSDVVSDLRITAGTGGGQESRGRSRVNGGPVLAEDRFHELLLAAISHLVEAFRRALLGVRIARVWCRREHFFNAGNAALQETFERLLGVVRRPFVLLSIGGLVVEEFHHHVVLNGSATFFTASISNQYFIFILIVF